MPEFIKLRDAVKVQLDKILSADQVFQVDLEGLDINLSKTYLENIPTEVNPIFRNRPAYECSCCVQFIKDVGGIVSIGLDGKYVSVWDVVGMGVLQGVADLLASQVKSCTLQNVFLIEKSKVGNKSNVTLLEGDTTTTSFDHFYGVIPTKFVKKIDKIPTLLGEKRSTFDVFKRGLNEITPYALDTVIELVGNSLAECQINKGFEYFDKLHAFKEAQVAYTQSPPQDDIFIWQNMNKPRGVLRLRNSVIGTLLVDLSGEMCLDDAVAKYEKKVDPTNFKRSNSLITEGMRNKAMTFAKEHGIEPSLSRCHAVFDDITVDNVIYANQAVREAKNVFDGLSVAPSKVVKQQKEMEVSVDSFIKDVMPHATKIEVLFENKHENNLVNLIAPSDKTAPNILKWDNNYSWSYNGGTTDSIKQLVNAKGGNTEGDLRISLRWYNADDLDLHLVEPDNTHIYHGELRPYGSKMHLDVDMNASKTNNYCPNSPVENIACMFARDIKNGINKVKVRQYSKRAMENVGFEVEVDFKGAITTFNYIKSLPQGKVVDVFDFSYHTGKDEVLFTNTIDSKPAVKTLWSLNTYTYQEVTMMLYSPNHWNGQEIGTKHLFFLLDKCVNTEGTRGLYNEFLAAEFHPHRKTFEALGTTLRVPPSESEEQLSGIGFALGNRNKVTCRVTTESSVRNYLISI